MTEVIESRSEKDTFALGQIRCRPGIIRLHPLPFPRFLLLLHTSSP